MASSVGLQSCEKVETVQIDGQGSTFKKGVEKKSGSKNAIISANLQCIYLESNFCEVVAYQITAI